jgi:hypothetical protein
MCVIACLSVVNTQYVPLSADFARTVSSMILKPEPVTFVRDSCVLPLRSDNRESKESLERQLQCSDLVVGQLEACPHIHFILLEEMYLTVCDYISRY